MINIPLTNQPNQFFSMSLPQGNSNLALSFRVYWNRIAEYWQMDITNDTTGQALILGVPMLTGQAPAQNMLSQYEYLGIGKAYVIPLSTASTDYPGLDDWGVNFILLWDTSA